MCLTPVPAFPTEDSHGVQDGSLFGFLFVDVETTPELQKELDDFPVVIKNMDISHKDIEPYMKKVAEKHEYLKNRNGI